MEEGVDKLVCTLSPPTPQNIPSSSNTDSSARITTGPFPVHRSRRHGRILCQRRAPRQARVSLQTICGTRNTHRAVTCTNDVFWVPSRSAEPLFPPRPTTRASSVSVQGWPVRTPSISCPAYADGPHSVRREEVVPGPHCLIFPLPAIWRNVATGHGRLPTVRPKHVCCRV